MEAGYVDIIPETVHILVDSAEKGVSNYFNKSQPTIYMVPRRMRDIIPSNFNPRIVSIGPLHKQDKNVQEIEEAKPVILKELLRKVESPIKETMTECVEKVSGRLKDIRACYGGLNAYKDVELVTMMVMDACFILYIFLQDLDSLQGKAVALSLFSDLVLLENQIPFFVLQDMFRCTILKFQPTADLNKLLLNVLQVVKPFEPELNTEIDGTNTNYDHILHFLHSSYNPPSNESRDDTVYVPPSYPVRELEKAGVIFKLNDDDKWALTIDFKSSWLKPTLTLPKLRLNVYTELVFSNLIAYEQRHSEAAYFTSYVVAMMNLLETKEDHLKLVDLKIARNNPGGSQYVVDLIRNLSKASDLKDFLYVKELKMMNNYCNSWLGWIRRTYFSSAWSYIASISGLIIFILTVIQTYCSIRGK